MLFNSLHFRIVRPLTNDNAENFCCWARYSGVVLQNQKLRNWSERQINNATMVFVYDTRCAHRFDMHTISIFFYLLFHWQRFYSHTHHGIVGTGEEDRCMDLHTIMSAVKLCNRDLSSLLAAQHSSFIHQCRWIVWNVSSPNVSISVARYWVDSVSLHLAPLRISSSLPTIACLYVRKSFIYLFERFFFSSFEFSYTMCIFCSLIDPPFKSRYRNT